MLNSHALAVGGGQIALLQDETLASITGGDGPGSWLLKKIGEMLFDCIAGGLDDLISAAEEGYEDAR